MCETGIERSVKSNMMLPKTTALPISLENGTLNQTLGVNTLVVYLDDSELLIVSVFYAILSLVGGTINLTVIASVVTGEGYLEAATNLFILSQAIADFLMSVLLSPMFIYYLHHPTENIYLQPIVQLATISAIGSLTLLAFNRALSIFAPFKYPLFMTVRRAIYLVTILWLIIITTASLSAVGMARNVNVIYTRLARFVAIPMICTIIVSYLYLYYKSRQHQEQVRCIELAIIGQERNLKEDFKSFKTLIMVTGVYILCWIPAVVIFVVIDSDNGGKTLYKLISWLGIPCLFNSACVNPIVYYLRSEEFSRSLRHFKHFLGDYIRYNSLTLILEYCACNNNNGAAADGTASVIPYWSKHDMKF